MDEQLVKILENISANQQQVTTMLAEIKGGQKSVGTVNTATLLHGLTGVFAGPGLDRDVLTAHVRPQGISTVLPKVPSIDEDPRFATLTGFTDPTGSQPTNACEDAPKGFVKGCNLTARFGLKRFDTQDIEMDKVMLRINRGDFKDLILRGAVLGLTDLVPSQLTQDQILNVVTLSEMVIVGVNMERALNNDMWQGTVAAGSFPGLDAQIATGQIDADLGTACAALDSDVKSFNYNNVCGTTLDIVEDLNMLAKFLQFNARRMGHSPVQWVIAMRPELWYELSACWPCKFLSNRCKDDTGTQLTVVNDRVNQELTMAMREGNFIELNGVRYPIIEDDGVFEHNSTNNANLAAGQFASSIYMVPLTIAGNFPVTTTEYVDYRQAEPDRRQLTGREDWWWTDNGRFSWAISQDRWCYNLALKTEMRVVLRTPQLAGKLQHIMYEPRQHLRDADADSPYWADGGVSIRPRSRGSAVWA